MSRSRPIRDEQGSRPISALRTQPENAFLWNFTIFLRIGPGDRVGDLRAASCHCGRCRGHPHGAAADKADQVEAFTAVAGGNGRLPAPGARRCSDLRRGGQNDPTRLTFLKCTWMSGPEAHTAKRRIFRNTFTRPGMIEERVYWRPCLWRCATGRRQRRKSKITRKEEREDERDNCIAGTASIHGRRTRFRHGRLAGGHGESRAGDAVAVARCPCRAAGRPGRKSPPSVWDACPWWAITAAFMTRRP